MAAIRAKVSEAGRVDLPAQHRKQLGLENGGEVVVWVEDGEIRMRSVDDALTRAQEEVRRLLGGRRVTVDDFLATRRQDTGE